ncbi:MAG: phosphotriesterase family protein [Candidatus Hermodarchaeia archaeon]|jgi:phosphotriesterase-related protein
MTRNRRSGKAQTVLGTLDANDLGITLPHEHLLCDASFMFIEPRNVSQKALAYEPVKIENLGWIRKNKVYCLDNLRLWDEELALLELLRFKKVGGSTIVDVTNIGLGRDPMGLTRISRATDVNIIMGAGYYLGPSHPPELAEKTEDTITDEILRDITVGVADTGIQAGILGEIGCSYPLKDGEEKVLRSAAQAQQITGIPVNIHPGHSNEAPFEIIDLLRENGGKINHTVMSHVENRLVRDIDLTLKLADTGCYLEYDTFGTAQNAIRLPNTNTYSLSDWERIECIKELIDHGHAQQLLISQDVFNKINLRRYGGYGYDHILTTIVPLMRMIGISNEQIHTILVENPKRMLQFA